jgi:hypothetical protein
VVPSGLVLLWVRAPRPATSASVSPLPRPEAGHESLSVRRISSSSPATELPTEHLACQVQRSYLYRMDREGEGWFVYDARSILQVVVDYDPMTWWRPGVDPPDGIDF